MLRKMPCSRAGSAGGWSEPRAWMTPRRLSIPTSEVESAWRRFVATAVVRPAMGFKEVQRQAVAALRAGTIQHEAPRRHRREEPYGDRGRSPGDQAPVVLQSESVRVLQASSGELDRNARVRASMLLLTRGHEVQVVQVVLRATRGMVHQYPQAPIGAGECHEAISRR